MDLSEFLLAGRTTALPDREVIDALVHPAHAGPSPALAARLARWAGTYYWSDEPEGRHLVLTRPARRPRREAWALHGILFVATLLTTTFVGAVFHGTLPYDPDPRSEEHTSELQSHSDLVCRLLLEKKKKN